MKRWVSARRRITGDPDKLDRALVSSAPALLQAATDTEPSSPRGDGAFAMRLVGRTVGVATHKTVWATLGEVRRYDNHLALPIRWQAEDIGRFMLPAFEGALELETLSSAVVELTVIGSYDPPLSPVGDFADVIGVGQVAQDTAQWLVEQLARAITAMVYGDSPPRVKQTLAMTVADVMTSNPLVLDEDMSIRTSASLMLWGGISGAPVVDTDGRVIGVLSERDLLDKAARAPFGFGRKARLADQHRLALTVGQACTKPARTTQAESTVRDAAREMAEHDIDRLVVMQGGELVGIVTRADVLKSLTRDHEDLEEAIHQVLIQNDHEEFVVAIEDGTVHLSGEARLLSDKHKTRERIEEIDGVIRVSDDDVLFTIDDLVPPTIPML